MELPQNLKLIVFDFDGTLFDMAIDWDEAKKLADPLPGESLGDATERHKKTGNDTPIKKLEALEAQALKDQILKPEVAQTLLRLANDYKIAVLTRNSSRPIKEMLQRSGIQPEIVVGREEAMHYKPHPEGLNLILQKLNILPSQALMVGDTWHDVEVAKAAGVNSVGVGPKVENFEQQPDYQLRSIVEL